MHDSISANDVREPEGAKDEKVTVLESFSAYAELRATASTAGRRHVIEVVEKQRELLAWLAREMLRDPDAARVGDLDEDATRMKVLELLASTVDVEETLRYVPVVDGDAE